MSKSWQFTSHVAEAKRAIRAGEEEGLDDGLQYLLDASNRLVPTLSGTLKASGRVVRDGTQGAVTYDVPYAVKEHEDMTAHHDDGQPKFLEAALNGEARQVGERIAAGIRTRT